MEHSDGFDEKRRLIEFTKKYSAEKLGFDVGLAFATESDSMHACYKVVWSPRTKLILNSRRFDDEHSALEERNRLSSEGNDAYVMDVIAYGGKDGSPVTRSLLEKPPEFVACAVIHEKWHDRVGYMSAYENAMVNEAAAYAIGLAEGIEVTKRFYGEGSPEHMNAVEQQKNYLEKLKAIKSLAEEMNELYESNMPESEMLEEKERLLDGFNKKFNYKIEDNAKLAKSYVYAALFPLAHDIYAKHHDGAVGIFIGAMRIAEEEGLEAGIEDLLMYSGLDGKEYSDIVGVV